MPSLAEPSGHCRVKEAANENDISHDVVHVECLESRSPLSQKAGAGLPQAMGVADSTTTVQR